MGTGEEPVIPALDNRLEDPTRLAALERSGLLTKPPTERLRQLVYTAYTLLRADAAQINVLGAHMQHTMVEWPRIAPPSADRPVEVSGCRLVLELEGTLVIPDALDHPVACTMPWVGVFRGYIGAVLCYEGQPIGALCALTVQPRQWSTTDKMTLEGLVSLVSQAVEL